MRIHLLAAALAATLAAPRAGAEPAELKIGYVDFQRGLNEVDLGKSAKATLKHDFEAKQKILDQEKSALDKMQADFEKQAVVLSEDARREKMAEIDKRG
jgi:outer membrane protein